MRNGGRDTDQDGITPILRSICPKLYQPLPWWRVILFTVPPKGAQMTLAARNARPGLSGPVLNTGTMPLRGLAAPTRLQQQEPKDFV